jgi:hypothetical protein
MSRCPNCSAELTGRYCSTCGQERIGAQDLSARRFFHDLADEIGTLRGRFKTLDTLRALLVPGLLTNEFLAGRRQRYLTPLQLYLVCAAVFFLAAPVAGFRLTSMIEADKTGELAGLVAARLDTRGLDAATFHQRFDLRLQSVYTVAIGAGVIVIAVTLQLLSRNALPFGAPLAFALHFFGFLFLATAVAGASRRLGLTDESAAAVGVCLIAAYLFVAIRRVYGGPTRYVLLRWAIVLATILAFNHLADVVAIRLTLAMV